MIRLTTSGTILTIIDGIQTTALSSDNINAFITAPQEHIMIDIADDSRDHKRIKYSDVISFNGVAPTSFLGLYDDLVAWLNTASGTPIEITDATVITAITLDANWNEAGQFVDPGGILAQLGELNWYLDETNDILYQYLSGKLVRTSVNTTGGW